MFQVRKRAIAQRSIGFSLQKPALGLIFAIGAYFVCFAPMPPYFSCSPHICVVEKSGILAPNWQFAFNLALFGFVGVFGVLKGKLDK